MNPVTVLPETSGCSAGTHIMTSDPNGATGNLMYDKMNIWAIKVGAG